MTTSPSLGQPEIQAELIAEALSSASVGFFVWDEDRRYVAANAAACEILGTTLDQLLGQRVGEHTVEGLEVFYATFTTKTAGMPFMATVIAPLSQG